MREKCESEVESSTAANDMPVEEILQAELAVDPRTESYVDAEEDPVTSICQAADKQLFSLVDWAKKIPHFMELPTDDQVTLLRAGRVKLEIFAGVFAFRGGERGGICRVSFLFFHLWFLPRVLQSESSASNLGVGWGFFGVGE